MLNASIQDNRTTRPQGATRGEVFLAGGKTTGREKHAGGPPREARRMDLKARRSSEKSDKNRKILFVHDSFSSFDHLFKCSNFSS